MVLLFQPTGPPGGGIGPTNLTTVVTNRSGETTAIGDVLQFDLAMTDGDVTNLQPGDAASGWNNVIDPTFNAITGLIPALFCVALEVAIDNALLKVCYWGRCKAFIISDTATVFGSRGHALAVRIDNTFDLVDQAGERLVAVNLDVLADTTPNTRILEEVFLFNTFLSGGGI